MPEHLKSELAYYLGQLMHQHENEFDWIEKDKISEKMNAVYTLLNINKHEKTWYQKLARELKVELK